MDDRRKLAGLSIEGFRNFLPGEAQRIGPLSKVHLLAGPNNSGKSNVLRVAQFALPTISGQKAFEWRRGDRPDSFRGSSLYIGVALDFSDDQWRANVHQDPDLLRQLLEDAQALDLERNVIWLEYELTEQDTWAPSSRAAEKLTSAANNRGQQPQLGQLSSALTRQSGGGAYDDASRVLGEVGRLMGLGDLPDVHTIGAFRQISGATAETSDGSLNGPGLIGQLAQLQHPPYGQEEDLERFRQINQFLGTLLDDPDTSIEIPHGNEEILVVHRGRRLPLENYGTGVHEAVILAAAATVVTESLICIEEPEVHLHPTLQRALLRYLNQETSNQYLVATHSAHMLDTGLASISSVREINGSAVVAAALSPNDVASIAADLGVRASDLVQANAVVWVEGPSDRTYVRVWLHSVDPHLVEGVHYSLVFYGGALLRYLAPEDPAVEEFIGLPRINRNFWVVIDSDRRAEDAPLGPTKARVIDQLANYPGRAGSWVTAGYTIENYVPSDLLREAVMAVHPGSELTWEGDPFANPLAGEYLGERSSPADKAAVATAVAARWHDVDKWPLDLHARVSELAAMVRAANDLQPIQ